MISINMPTPEINQEPLYFSPTEIKIIPVKSWTCNTCGAKIGEFSAQRAIQNHHKIICPDCAKKEHRLILGD